MMRRMIPAMLLVLVRPVCALRVLVTGAGGRTGRLVFEQLKESTEHSPVGLARSKAARKSLKQVGASESEMVSGDVMDFESMRDAMQGFEAVVLCTSAVPKIKPLSLLKFLVKKLLRFKDPGRPAFSFPLAPEQVDWIGAKNQIDAAVAAGVSRFVMVGSMGGTQPDNFLNSIGRKPDGTGGDILLWKRKAERYLTSSKLDYFIVHPGGLVDDKPAQRELLVGVDDTLLELKTRSIPRSDVARVCCAALTADKPNVAIDVVAKPKGEGQPTLHAAEVFNKLEDDNMTYDYESDVQPDPPSIFANAADD